VGLDGLHVALEVGEVGLGELALGDLGGRARYGAIREAGRGQRTGMTIG
jgi:hypothetical protein